MAINQFENSRITEGTLRRDAQKVGETSREPLDESNAVSRDDARDGSPEYPQRVVAASMLTGNRVRNRAGEDLGTIDEIMIDIPTSRIAYTVLSFGGVLGIGNKLFAVPLNALRIDPAGREFILDVDRDRLENAPGFEKDNWPEVADPAFGDSKQPEWQADVTDAGDYTGDDRQRNRSIEYEPATSYRAGHDR